MNFPIDLFISYYNRPEYLKQSLKSLTKSIRDIIPDVLLTDDGSNSPEIVEIVGTFIDEYPGKVIFKSNPVNLGIPYGKLMRIRNTIMIEDYDKPLFLISDSDMIYKARWIETLLKIYQDTGAPLVTGFHTISNGHVARVEFKTYRTKHHIGGCSLLVSTEFYKSHPFMERREWDFRMCERAWEQYEMGVVCSKPSVADHIGQHGVWARSNYYDQAEDF
jgi:GT2 family glycosyltransferase